MLKPLDAARKPDILDCIASLSSDEVFTPPRIANQVLDLLPPEVWSDPSLKFLDPACKTGVFLREAAKRLMDGLCEAIPDEARRREHIFKHMLYGIAITELTGLAARRTLYYSKDASSAFSVVKFDSPQGNILYRQGAHRYRSGKCQHCGAPEGLLDRGEHLENHAYLFIHDTEIWPVKFDVIIGNPPYQLQDAGKSTGASPIYHRFVEQAKKLNPRYLSMIIPSRWFAGGKGLDEFREAMLNDRRVSRLVDYHNEADCFPGVDIKGGVCFFLWDSRYQGDCEVTPVMNGERQTPTARNLAAYDVFVRFNQAVPILEKVRAKGDPSLSEKLSSRKPFGFATNFTDFSAEPFDGAVEIYANSTTGWIARERVTVNRQWLDQYKVLVSRAYGGGNAYPHQVIGRPILAGKSSCCTETYIVCGVFDNREAAQNLEAYMKTRFLRFLVWLRKISQDNPRDRFLFVPDLDMSESWTDERLYARYGLTPDEIAFIEAMVKEIP